MHLYGWGHELATHHTSVCKLSRLCRVMPRVKRSMGRFTVVKLSSRRLTPTDRHPFLCYLEYYMCIMSQLKGSFSFLFFSFLRVLCRFVTHLWETSAACDFVIGEKLAVLRFKVS